MIMAAGVGKNTRFNIFVKRVEKKLGVCYNEKVLESTLLGAKIKNAE